MKTKDFEKAIGDLGVQGLQVIRYFYQLNGGVAEAYARLGELTWMRWDATGRAFRFDQPSDMEGCISSENVRYLDYRRDADFDLRFL